MLQYLGTWEHSQLNTHVHEHLDAYVYSHVKGGTRGEAAGRQAVGEELRDMHICIACCHPFGKRGGGGNGTYLLLDVDVYVGAKIGRERR